MRADLAGLKCVCDEIARVIQSAESSAIFLLVGDIGAGKTTLVREFAKRIGITDSVTSPTFSLLHIYNADNSVLGMQFRTCKNFGESTDSSLVLSPKFSQIQKPHHNHFDCDSLCKSTANQAQIAESNLDSAESQNLNKNNPRVSANLESRPLRGAKNREQGRSSASADFLLEAEKRGSPPKSEKRQLLGIHLNNSRGEREQGGAALLRKESSKNNGNEIAESRLDSTVDCHESANADSRNDEFILDSTNPTQKANSAIADEFLGFCEASDKDKTKVYRGSEPKQSLKSRCESKFATTIYHYDLYQKGIDYAIELGLLDLLSENGIHFVEWGDRRLFEIIKDAFENIFILQITKAKNDRIYELKREF